MGAPVYNTGFVGQGTRVHKRVMSSCQPSGIDIAYSNYKAIEGQAKKAYEMGTGLYSAYKIGRQAYPYLRAGIQAAMA